MRGEQADIGFFAIDPARSDGLRFTDAYLLIEGSYLVAQNSPLHDNAEVNRVGTRIAVGSGSAYDLFLTRELQHASIVRVLHAPETLAALKAGQVEVAAGIRQLLEDGSRHDATLRLLPGRFMLIQQAMGMPASRGDEAQAALVAFVEEMKASGMVAESLRRHGIQGAIVAPPA